jgi:hypothetical protein
VRKAQAREGVLGLRREPAALAERERAQQRASGPRLRQPLVEPGALAMQGRERSPALALGHTHVQGGMGQAPGCADACARELAQPPARARVRELGGRPQHDARAHPLARQRALERLDTQRRIQAAEPDCSGEPDAALAGDDVVEIDAPAARPACPLAHTAFERHPSGAAAPRAARRAGAPGRRRPGGERETETRGAASGVAAPAAAAPASRPKGPQHQRRVLRHERPVGEQHAGDLREREPGKQSPHATSPGPGQSARG